MASFVADEAVWKPEDWKWDAHNLKAMPVEAQSPAQTPGGKSAKSQKGDDAKQGCQVEGCTIEVAGQKDYHSRYKICEYHLKANVVQKSGAPHRFCQQCGKFQPLQDFDGEKRSCRARLDKHNARRRRQREMALMLKKTGTIDEALLTQKYGLTGEQLAPKLARMTKQGYAVKSSRSSSAGPSSGKAAKSASPSASPRTEAAPTATSGGGTSNGDPASMFAAAAAQQQQQQQQQPGPAAPAGVQAQQAPVTQADLLATASSRPAAMAHCVLPGNAAIGALLLDDDFLEEVFNPMLSAGLSQQGPNSLPAASAAHAAPPASGTAAAAFMQLDSAAAMALDDLEGLERLTSQLMAAGALPAAPPPLPGGPAAPWPAAAPAFSAGPHRGSMPPTPSTSEAAMATLPPYLAAQQAGFSTLLGGAAPFGGGLQPPPPLPGAMRADLGGRVESPGSVRSALTAMDLGRAPAQGTVLDEALNLLSYDSAQISYVPEEKLVRFSAKLFNCTPAQLPADLKASLVNMLSCQSMEGYLRPGCVHITVNALMGCEERQLMASSGVRAVVERLVARQPQEFWSQRAMLVQLGDKLALVREGRVVHVLATASSSLFPRLAALRPLAAAPDAQGACQLALWGHNLDGEEDVLLARCNGAYFEAERLSLEQDPAWGGLQKLNLRLTGLPAVGALQLEVMRGAYLSEAKAMLLTRDAALAAEVRGLEAEERADTDTLLFQLAAAAQYAAGAERDYSPADREVLGRSSRRLLAFAVQRQWVAATRTVLAAVCADQAPAEAMAEADVMCVGTTGMPLLQLAVRSQRADLLASLLDWGDARGHSFKATTPGRRGLTALHLAGLLADGGATAALLCERCPDAAAGWEDATAEDGAPPIEYARRAGNAAAVERALATRRYEAAVAAATAAGAELDADKAALLRHHKPVASDSASSSTSPFKGVAHPSGDAEGEEEDGVADAKAAIKARRAHERRLGPLLTFSCPQLEARYRAWSSAGQVPVDIAFLVIATLSQAAWIFRWSVAASWLGLAMVALMALNAAMMQTAVLFPGVYVRWRAPLCLLSHVAHKLAQSAVTLLPPVGTIFSPTYNPTVALLESSSLAQVHMLSFGMRLHFGAHLLALLIHLALAVAANDAICAAGFPFLPGGACRALMALWQALACGALPCGLVYVLERRSRRIFLETVSD